MKITRKDVEHVADLAHLRFTEEEIEPFTRQLNRILEYFEKLQDVDTAGVEPSTHAVSLNNAFRADAVQSSLPAEEALENAPDREQTYFKVPKIIEV